uniref:DNA excision repair protein ERCC-1 n=1 Tax=Crypthecodinium cohnii TaxID=2866 RepID=A0A516AGQ7_CRYCO|nr:DNA excision repair protein ERCC-1 [Crypthecodinium cohnii]USW07868.1 DNA excision repair protein ERCC-1 [Crypthecodinium cohnii]
MASPQAAATSSASAASAMPAASGGEVALGEIYHHPRAAHVILAATRQRGNPILNYVKSTMVEFMDGLAPDYLVGPTIAVYFLSLKFHRTRPDYLSQRIKSLGSGYRARILLCVVDLEHPEEQLAAVTLQAFHAEISLLLAWSHWEAASYLETFHRHQNKSSEVLQAKLSRGDDRARLAETITAIKGINKGDAATFIDRFGSFEALANASEEELHNCPRIGAKKVRQLQHVFHTPFFS